MGTILNQIDDFEAGKLFDKGICQECSMTFFWFFFATQ